MSSCDSELVCCYFVLRDKEVETKKLNQSSINYNSKKLSGTSIDRTTFY